MPTFDLGDSEHLKIVHYCYDCDGARKNSAPAHRDYVRGGSVGALAPPEFGGSERRTEGETDNPLLIAPSESKS